MPYKGVTETLGKQRQFRWRMHFCKGMSDEFQLSFQLTSVLLLKVGFNQSPDQHADCK